LRLLFESCAIRTGNFDLSKIGELKKEMESLQKEPDKKRNKHMFLELDKRLHCLLIQSSDNRRMQNFFFRIYDLVVMCLSFVKRLYDSTEEHIEMLNAIQNGDPEKACKILEVHLRDSQDIILRELEDLQTRQKKG